MRLVTRPRSPPPGPRRQSPPPRRRLVAGGLLLNHPRALQVAQQRRDGVVVRARRAERRPPPPLPSPSTREKRRRARRPGWRARRHRGASGARRARKQSAPRQLRQRRGLAGFVKRVPVLDAIGGRIVLSARLAVSGRRSRRKEAGATAAARNADAALVATDADQACACAWGAIATIRAARREVCHEGGARRERERGGRRARAACVRRGEGAGRAAGAMSRPRSTARPGRVVRRGVRPGRGRSPRRVQQTWPRKMTESPSVHLRPGSAFVAAPRGAGRRGGRRAEEARGGSTTTATVPGWTTRDAREGVRRRCRGDQGKGQGPTGLSPHRWIRPRASAGSRDNPIDRIRRDSFFYFFERRFREEAQPGSAPASDSGCFITSRRRSVLLLLLPHRAGLFDGCGGLERRSAVSSTVTAVSDTTVSVTTAP